MTQITVPAIAGFSLGFFMGFLAWYFVTRLSEFTTGTLVALVGVLVGGVVTRFIDESVKGTGVVWYPIGLAVGLLVYLVIGLAGRNTGVCRLTR